MLRTRKLLLILLIFCGTILSARKNGYFIKDGEELLHYNGRDYYQANVFFVDIDNDLPLDTSITWIGSDNLVYSRLINSSQLSDYKNKNMIGAWDRKTGRLVNSSSGNISYSRHIISDEDLELYNGGSSFGKKGSRSFEIQMQFEQELDRLRSLSDTGSKPLSNFERRLIPQVHLKQKSLTKSQVSKSQNMTQKAFETRNIEDIKAAIRKNREARDFIESKAYEQLPTGTLVKTRESKRRASEKYTAHDGKKFKNKKVSLWNKAKKGIYKVTKQKSKLKKSKYHRQIADTNGLDCELDELVDLLNEVRTEISSEVVVSKQMVFDNTDNGVGESFGNTSASNIGESFGKNFGESNLKDEFIADPNLDKVNHEIDLGTSKDSLDSTSVNEGISNVNYSSSSINKPSSKSPGFVKRTATKVANFLSKPEVIESLDSANQAGLRNVLLDKNVSKAISDAVPKFKEIFKGKKLSKDFEANVVNSGESNFVPRALQTHTKPSGIHSDINYKNFVKTKIESTELKLVDFYKECESSIIHSHRDPLIYYSNEYSKETCEVVSYGLDLANDYFNENKFELANDFTDLSSSLLDAAKGTKKFLKLVRQGALQGVSKYKDPLNVIKEFGEGFVNLAVVLGKTTLKFAEYNVTCLTDSDRAAVEMYQFFTSAADKLTRIKNTFFNLSYEEKVILISKTITEMVVDSAVTGGVTRIGSGAGKLLKALPNLVEKEMAVAKLASKVMGKTTSTLKKVSAPLGNAVMETEAFIQNAARNGRNTVLGLLEFIESQPAVALSADSIGAVTLRGSNSFKDFAKYKKAISSSYGKESAKKVGKALKGQLREKNLPVSGRIRFVPDKSTMLTRKLKALPGGGYKDRFGNIWKADPRKSVTDAYKKGLEWDVQLSSRGRKQIAWTSKNGRYVNVNPLGEVTH